MARGNSADRLKESHEEHGHKGPLEPGNEGLGQHAFIMLGTKALFLCHMTMFDHEEHCYQCVIRATLPDDVMAAYRKEYGTTRRVPGGAWPQTLFLANTKKSLISVAQLQSGRCKEFRADIFHGVPKKEKALGWPWSDDIKKDYVFKEDVAVKVERIVFSRHFDFGFARPQKLAYVLFGQDDEAHMTNYQVKDPDFDHVLSLGRSPAWLPLAKLEAGIQVTFDIDSRPNGAQVHCCNPLEPGRYMVKYQGQGPAKFDVQVGNTWWFSTAIVNENDPCK